MEINTPNMFCDDDLSNTNMMSFMPCCPGKSKPHKCDDDPAVKQAKKDFALLFCGSGYYSLTRDQIKKVYNRLVDTIKKHRKIFTDKEYYGLSELTMCSDYEVGSMYANGSMSIDSMDTFIKDNYINKYGIGNDLHVGSKNRLVQKLPHMGICLSIDITSFKPSGYVYISNGKNDNVLQFVLKYKDPVDFFYKKREIENHIRNVVNTVTELMEEIKTELFDTVAPLRGIIGEHKHHYHAISYSIIIPGYMEDNTMYWVRNGFKYDNKLMDKLLNVDALPEYSRKIYDYLMENKKVKYVDDYILVIPEVKSFFTDKNVEKQVIEKIKKHDTVYWDDVKDFVEFKIDRFKLVMQRYLSDKNTIGIINWNAYLYHNSVDDLINNKNLRRRDVIKKISKSRYVTDDMYYLLSDNYKNDGCRFKKEWKEKINQYGVFIVPLPSIRSNKSCFDADLTVQDTANVIVNGKKYKLIHKIYCNCCDFINIHNKWYIPVKLHDHTARMLSDKERNALLDKIYYEMSIKKI